GYELELPAEVNDEHSEATAELVSEVGLVAKNAGLSQEIAQTFVDAVAAVEALTENKFDMAAMRELAEAGDEVGAQRHTTHFLEMRYGASEAKDIVRDAQEAVAKLPESVADYLDRTGLGNSPSVLVVLARYQRGQLHMTPLEAQSHLDLLIRKKS